MGNQRLVPLVGEFVAAQIPARAAELQGLVFRLRGPDTNTDKSASEYVQYGRQGAWYLVARKDHQMIKKPR